MAVPQLNNTHVHMPVYLQSCTVVCNLTNNDTKRAIVWLLTEEKFNLFFMWLYVQALRHRLGLSGVM